MCVVMYICIYIYIYTHTHIYTCSKQHHTQKEQQHYSTFPKSYTHTHTRTHKTRNGHRDGNWNPEGSKFRVVLQLAVWKETCDDHADLCLYTSALCLCKRAPCLYKTTLCLCKRALTSRSKRDLWWPFRILMSIAMTISCLIYSGTGCNK